MPLARYQFTVTDAAGNVVPNANVEVRREISGQPLAPLYSDRDGLVALGNPFAADADGFAYFHVTGGSYQIRVYTGASGAPTFEAPLWRYVGIGLNAEGDGVGILSQVTITGAGTLVIEPSDPDQFNIKKATGAPTRVVLPISALRAKSVRIVDRKYDAATNNITIVPKRPSAVTVSIASPAVVTLAAHGQAANDPVSFETTGALPTGLSADTQYYVKTVLSSSTFTVSETPGGAAINTSGSQSGEHSMGTNTIMGGAAYRIDSNGASLQLVSLLDGSGWV